MRSPRGACIQGLALKAIEGRRQEPSDPGKFHFCWILRKGKFEEGIKLKDVLNQMGEGDVYIKGLMQ
jgi:hypothetical protein